MQKKRVPICGVSYRVVRAPGKEMESCQGLCDPMKGEIRIDRRLSGAGYRSTFEHEIGHATCEESGARFLMNQFLDADRVNKLEEILCRVWLPAYTAVIRGGH
jgi:hypothetical protein